MEFEEWEPIYEKILEDMRYSRRDDESSARMLSALMLNADLMSIDEFSEAVGRKVSIFGAAECLESDIEKKKPEGTLISAGSAVGRVMGLGLTPDIVITDLDGDIGPQLETSRRGSITAIHAHGDNADMIREYAPKFEGKVILTTQSTPNDILYNFGGFTDGDRAYCIAEHFGAEITLYGFDYEHPYPKDGTDMEIKKKKLMWAKRIIETRR